MPRVGEDNAPTLITSVKSPKSCAFPVDAIVIKSIVLIVVGLPEGLKPGPNNPRV